MQLLALVEQSLDTVAPRLGKGSALKVEECDVFTETALDGPSDNNTSASMRASTAPSVIASDHVLEAITRALELGIADDTLTWEIWEQGFATPLVEASDVATEAVLGKADTHWAS